MHGFVSYRRFGRARSLRNDQAMYVRGRYVATEFGSSSVATDRALARANDRAWLVRSPIAILELARGRFGCVSVPLDNRSSSSFRLHYFLLYHNKIDLQLTLSTELSAQDMDVFINKIENKDLSAPDSGSIMELEKDSNDTPISDDPSFQVLPQVVEDVALASSSKSVAGVASPQKKPSVLYLSTTGCSLFSVIEIPGSAAGHCFGRG
ncbi:hypothetical protein DY000_02025235 [Brassica cretica]|uniref:Uncharacterized protein n=1 Tax=Brassica cretica TaxID=69181 RepID=A0ABQ7EJY1_BRACR|nr:hypothetical protein DY000_02025235 [Brassica cretica]